MEGFLYIGFIIMAALLVALAAPADSRRPGFVFGAAILTASALYVLA